MATINPASLYSQNQGIFNARPYVQHEEQLQARQAAKDEAISNYYEELPNKVNGAGLAYEDVEGLSKMVNKNQQSWIQNSKAINKGLTPENANYMQAIRDSHAYIEKGKDKVKELNLGNQLRQKKGFEYLNNDKGFTDALASGSLPINDPNYKPFKSSAFEIPRSPYDINKNNKFYDAIKPDMTDVTYEPIQGSKIQQTEVRTPKLNIDQFNKVHQQATSELYDDDRVGTYVKGWLDKNPDQLPLMNKVFEKSSGHPIRPYSDGDVVTAYRLLNMGMAATSKEVPNGQAKFDATNRENDRRAARNQGYKQANIALNQNAAAAGLGINDVYNKIDQNQSNGDININYKKGGNLIKTVKGARFNSLPNDAQQILMPALRAVDKNANVSNVYTIREDDGSIGIYKTDDKNEPTPSVETRITTISRTGINLKAQADSKGKKAVVAQGEPNKAVPAQQQSKIKGTKTKMF